MSNAEPLVLRGYGLVIGLGKNGGSDCPTTIRNYLVEFYQKELSPTRAAESKNRVSPKRLIDSPDTAVVAIYGNVPPGSNKGTRFDLTVEAIGNQTRSLDGGNLLPCDLKVFDVSASGSRLVAGRTLARARGPLYMNPRESPGARDGESPRRAYVLGGGRTIDERPVRLLLLDPSYSQAQRIERRLNERFGQQPPCAEAMSKGYLILHTPKAYGDRPGRFLELVPHVLMENAPAFVEHKLRELTEHVDASPASLHHLSLVWEALGRVAVAQTQPLYQRDDPALSFFSARAGLRLRDVSALPVIARIAQQVDHPYRLAAIRELGACKMPLAAGELTPLLNSDDDEIRIAAYQALTHYHHPAVRSQRFSSATDPLRPNLTLDIVESTSHPLIYVRRSLEPRIAVFGAGIPVARPVFYNHPNDWVTVNALENSDTVTLFRRTRTTNRLSEQLRVAPRIVDIIRALAALPIPDRDGSYHGLGLEYSLIVDTLSALSRDHAIAARVVLEDALPPEPLRPAPERPEGDEPPAPDVDAAAASTSSSTSDVERPK